MEQNIEPRLKTQTGQVWREDAVQVVTYRAVIAALEARVQQHAEYQAERAQRQATANAA